MFKLLIMHFVLACSVSIGDLDASPFVDELEVRSSWRELTDTCTITLPKKLVDFGLVDIKAGQYVKANVGYRIPGDNPSEYRRDVFSGYVAAVNPKIPLEVVCEDATYMLKRTPINKSWTTKVTLKEVVKYLVDSSNNLHDSHRKITIDYSVMPDIELEGFRIANRNAAQVLDSLSKDPYNLAVYMRDHELKVHIAYLDIEDETVSYDLAANVPFHDLEYRNDGDVKVQVKAVIVKDDNNSESILYGDEGGDTITLKFDKIDNPDVVKLLSEARLKRLGEGYKGSVTTFFIPYARHSWKATVNDPNYNRSETYYIDGTTLKFGDGITIKSDLGIKLS